jgi:hypothetical protein
MEQCQ